MGRRLSVEELHSLLPPRLFWFTQEVASAYGIYRESVQRCAKKYNIGTIRDREKGGRGIRVFYTSDLEKLSQHLRTDKE